jgi:hypothetical protein
MSNKIYLYIVCHLHVTNHDAGAANPFPMLYYFRNWLGLGLDSLLQFF